MTLSMYQASAPVFMHMLTNLSNILAKAQAEVDAGRLEETDLMEARLAPGVTVHHRDELDPTCSPFRARSRSPATPPRA